MASCLPQRRPPTQAAAISHADDALKSRAAAPQAPGRFSLLNRRAVQARALNMGPVRAGLHSCPCRGNAPPGWLPACNTYRARSLPRLQCQGSAAHPGLVHLPPAAGGCAAGGDGGGAVAQAGARGHVIGWVGEWAVGLGDLRSMHGAGNDQRIPRTLHPPWQRLRTPASIRGGSDGPAAPLYSQVLCGGGWGGGGAALDCQLWTRRVLHCHPAWPAAPVCHLLPPAPQACSHSYRLLSVKANGKFDGIDCGDDAPLSVSSGVGQDLGAAFAWCPHQPPRVAHGQLSLLPRPPCRAPPTTLAPWCGS